MTPATRLLLPLFLLGVLTPVATETLTVDGDGSADFASIQAAIDAADPGVDDVLVRCGRYVENLVMRDGVSVRGQDAGCTTIDPALDDRPVVEMTALGPATELRGFTVRNRVSNWLSSNGIRVRQGTPTITRNVIVGEGSIGYTGSGVVVESGAAPVISYNIIRGNYSCCNGGGIAIGDSSPVIRSNLIVRNLSYYGGGVANYYGQPTIEHNTVVENQGWVGGGLFASGVDPVTLRGNIVAFNTAQIYGGGIVEWVTIDPHDNDFFDNVPDNYSGLDRTGTDGNVSVDPQFVDQNVNSFAGFGLRSSSPLIDGGDPATAPMFDLRGVPRTVDGDADGAAFPDIGARENEGITGLLVQKIIVSWDPGLQAPELYELFRGDLALLRDGGPYTQDPAAVGGARHFCGVGNGVLDTDLPAPGAGFFFLVAGRGAVGGTIGFDSAPAERSRSFPCTD